MAISVAGVPLSRKLPGVLLNVVLGGPGTSAGSAQMTLLLMGNMVTADITGAAPAFTVSAGSYRTSTTPTNQPVRLLSSDDALGRFGTGSELHLMALGAFAQYSDCPLYGLPVAAVSGGTASSALIYLSGTATSSGIIRLWIAGQQFDVNIPSGRTVDLIVGDVTAAILAVTTLPVTAQYAAGPVSPVTLTSKHVGARGNLITLRASLISGTTEVDVPSNTGTTSPPSTTATLFGVTMAFYDAAANSTTTQKYMTKGAGVDTANFGVALTALAKTRFHRIAVAGVDGAATNDTLDRLRTFLIAQAGPTKGLRQQGIAAVVTTLSAALGTSVSPTPSYYVNDPRIQLVLHPRASELPCQIAAQVGAARLIGDNAAGSTTVGEATDVATNLDGCRLIGITQQPYDGDRMSPDDPDTALQYGLTPLVPSAARVGYMEIARSITSRWRDDTAAPNYGVLDTSDVSVTDFVADLIAQRFATDFKGYRVLPESDDGPKIERATMPSLVKAWLHALLKTEEEAGHVVEVDDRLPLLQVQPRVGVPWWLNAEIPVVPIPGLHVFAANVRQLTARL